MRPPILDPVCPEHGPKVRASFGFRCPGCEAAAADPEQLPLVPDAPAAVLPSPDANRIGRFMGPDHGAPVTQRQAAILAYPNTGTNRRLVLDYIAAQGDRGATDEEVESALGMLHQTASARRNELMNDGWIEPSGRTRRTRGGRDAVAWTLTADGRGQWRAT